MDENINRMDKRTGAAGRKELLQCPVCEAYFVPSEGFYCSVCKRGPLCQKHRVYGRKECTSCAIDLRLKDLRNLREQEKNTKHFIRFLQFVFIVVVIYYVSFKYSLLDEIDLTFLEKNLLVQNLIPIGLGVLVLWGVFYAVLLNQRKKVSEAESEIEKMGGRR